MICLRSALVLPTTGTESETTIAVLLPVNIGLREDFKNPDLRHATRYSDYISEQQDGNSSNSFEPQPRWIHYHVMNYWIIHLKNDLNDENRHRNFTISIAMF